MTGSVTINALAAPQTYAPFTISGTYTVPGIACDAAAGDIGYADGTSTTLLALPSPTIGASTGTFSFEHPGLTVAGPNTINVGINGGSTASVTVSAVAPLTLTPTSGGQVFDLQGNTWTLTSAGVATENGVASPGGNSTEALTAVQGVIYGQSANNNVWWTWTNGAWVSTGSVYLPRASAHPDAIGGRYRDYGERWRADR
jgi:hypothetical protein